MEDFAQVLVKYAHEKYRSANYEQIGRILYQYSGQALTDVQQLARRLLSNALLANGDAHLKNWSLLYQDRRTPILAPAYDIVTTRAYIANESEFALNLGKTKSWYELTLAHFQAWALKAGVPWRAIRPVLLDVMEKARTLWPAALDELPMGEGHKKRCGPIGARSTTTSVFDHARCPITFAWALPAEPVLGFPETKVSRPPFQRTRCNHWMSACALTTKACLPRSAGWRTLSSTTTTT